MEGVGGPVRESQLYFKNCGKENGNGNGRRRLCDAISHRGRRRELRMATPRSYFNETIYD